MTEITNTWVRFVTLGLLGSGIVTSCTGNTDGDESVIGQGTSAEATGGRPSTAGTASTGGRASTGGTPSAGGSADGGSPPATGGTPIGAPACSAVPDGTCQGCVAAFCCAEYEACVGDCQTEIECIVECANEAYSDAGVTGQDDLIACVNACAEDTYVTAEADDLLTCWLEDIRTDGGGSGTRCGVECLAYDAR